MTKPFPPKSGQGGGNSVSLLQSGVVVGRITNWVV